MFSWIHRLDIAVVTAVQKYLSSGPADQLALLVSGHDFWWGVATCAVIALLYRRQPSWIAFLVAVVVTLSVSDAFSTRILKPYVDRPRPCYELGHLRLPGGCGGRQSFPSNHSSNAMAIAVLVLLHGPRMIGFAGVALALLVGFSRVYLGVHYPTDVLAGFIQGAVFALIVSFGFRRYLPEHTELAKRLSRWTGAILRSPLKN